MRVGFFGGSFDPPHVGHLLVADDAYAQLELDRLVFVPTGAQPLKAASSAAPPAVRLEMVSAMVAGDTRFSVSPLEVERPGLSYTVDTLRHFREELPDADRFLLLGADVVSTFDQWREPAEIVRLADPVILARGDDMGPGEAKVLAGVPARRVATRRIDVTSTEVRERVRRGLPLRGFVTDAVAAIIARDGLYR